MSMSIDVFFKGDLRFDIEEIAKELLPQGLRAQQPGKPLLIASCRSTGNQPSSFSNRNKPLPLPAFPEANAP
jgi:hypothetical protein